MSITLYREGLPRVEVKASWLGSREGMLVGFAQSHSDSPEIDIQAILMLEDGTLTKAGIGDFRIQFHYDVETDSWVDENDRAVEPDEDP